MALQAEIMSPAEQAKILSSKISTIAKALLQEGFFAEAYAVPALDQNSILSFKSFTLWEGGKDRKRSIPLTFFIYAWPSEEVALKNLPLNTHNNLYASPIHSHPMPCAFAILHGTLIQKNYLQDERYPNDKIACFLNEEVLDATEGDVDTLDKPFIHQVYCKKSPLNICLSLHAYGLPTAQKVKDCYTKYSADCTYKILTSN